MAVKVNLSTSTVGTFLKILLCIENNSVVHLVLNCLKPTFLWHNTFGDSRKSKEKLTFSVFNGRIEFLIIARRFHSYLRFRTFKLGKGRFWNQTLQCPKWNL
jgi:hypothetical protein